MANFACEHCERTYVHRRNLVQHIKKNHADQESLERPNKTGLEFSCDQCCRTYIHRRNLDRHVCRNYTAHPAFRCTQCEKSFARSYHLEMHKRTCVGGRVTAAAPAAKKRRITGVTPEFVVRKTLRSLGGAVELFTVDMKEAKHLSALQGAITAFKPVLGKFHREQHAYKFQISVDVVFHKAVDPAVITEPPVTLTSEMIAVYADKPCGSV